MEKGVFIRRLDDLAAAKEYGYVYFGAEFCQWLIPAYSELEKVSEYCDSSGKSMVIVTPWCTDTGVDIVLGLLRRHVEASGRAAVVVNDFGVLKAVSDEFAGKVSISAGRLLSNQRRDPRTLSLRDIDARGLYEHYRHSSFDYQPYIDFLKKYGVNRVEIDNPPQGIIIPDDVKGVSFSIHYPFNFVTVARNCPFCYNEGTASDPWENKKGCARRCTGKTLRLDCGEIDESLIMKGTALFIRNDDPDLPESVLIDRVVYSPYVPG